MLSITEGEAGSRNVSGRSRLVFALPRFGTSKRIGHWITAAACVRLACLQMTTKECCAHLGARIGSQHRPEAHNMRPSAWAAPKIPRPRPDSLLVRAAYAPSWNQCNKLLSFGVDGCNIRHQSFDDATLSLSDLNPRLREMIVD